MSHRRPTAALVGVVALLATVAVACDPVPPRPSFRAVATAAGPDAAPGDGTCATAAGGCSLEAALDEANAHPRARVVVAPGTHPGGDLTVTGDVELLGEEPFTTAGVPADAGSVDLTIAAGGVAKVRDLGLGALAVDGTLAADRLVVGLGASDAPAGLDVGPGATAVVATTVVDGRNRPAVRSAGTLALRSSTLALGPDPAVTTVDAGTTSLGGVHVLPAVATPGPACAGPAPTTAGWNVTTDATCALTAPTDRAGVTDTDAIPTRDSRRTDAVPVGSLGCRDAASTDLGTTVALDGDGDGTAACDVGAIEAPGLAFEDLPMGGPRNHIGLGALPALGDPERLFLSINPSCTSKINGDRHQSPHYGPLYTSGNLRDTSLSSCPATPTNPDFRPEGYELVVEAPEARTDDLEVLLHDARYNDDVVTVTTGEECREAPLYNPATYAVSWTQPSGSGETVLAGPAQVQTRASSATAWGTQVVHTLAWGQTIRVTAPDLIRYKLATGVSWSPSATTVTTASSNITLDGPAVYQKRTRTADAWGTVWTALAQGQSTNGSTNLIRYRTATLPTKTTCTPTTVSEAGIDSTRQSGQESFTFSLVGPDGTAVPGCTRTYAENSAFDAITYLGSVRWNRLCRITPDMAAGDYVLRARNGAPGVLTADGSNQWGLVAKYAGATGTGLCDGRVTPDCPRVYGRGALSVYANTDDAVASFPLAEVDASRAGRTLEIELFDPGEGGNNIQILRPTGTSTWTPAPFRFTALNDDGSVFRPLSDETTRVDVTSSLYNGKLVRIEVPLDGYAPPADNQWWKVQYTFGDGDRDVTDRTTWTARVTA